LSGCCLSTEFINPANATCFPGDFSAILNDTPGRNTAGINLNLLIMLGKSTNKVQTPDTSSVNLIGGGTKITGDITSAGDVRIDGHLTGNIIIAGKFVLGPNGMVEGNITSANADLSGEVKGKVNVSDILSLKASARINGDILTGKLSIEPGALFTGTCNMGAKVKNINTTPELENAGKTA
jgi:cytoskeletal protein CcmA (bactofilin family)